MNERLYKQLEFLVEIDKLKQVFRQSFLVDGSRHENDAEHSWHLAVMAIFLSEHAKERTMDIFKVIKLVLIHDIVEIDAGDTFCYNEEAGQTKADREQKAADRLFNLLPDDQAKELRSLWGEFEARETQEARFAAALDRLQPLLHNYKTQGKSWRSHGITREQVLNRNRHIAEGSPELWRFALKIVDESVAKGYLAE